jgi:hypothetical protein
MPSPVTAVGRRIRPRNGEPRRYRVIAVRPGSVRTVVDRIIPSAPAVATVVDQPET